MEHASHIAHVGGLVRILPPIRRHLVIVMVLIRPYLQARLRKLENSANILGHLGLLVFKDTVVR